MQAFSIRAVFTAASRARRTAVTVAALIGVLGLAACGGGRDRDEDRPSPPANAVPQAQAGPEQNVAIGATVTLDGRGSTDADGDALTYAWTLNNRPSGSAAVLAGANTATPSFVADVAGTFEATLVVSDGKVSSSPSKVKVNAAAKVNAAPVANAGASQSVVVGDAVVLNGRGSSDADGDALTYAWTLSTRPAGSAATLAGASTATPTFVPDVAGTYVATLVVNDGKVNGAPAQVSVTAAVGNAAPVANAGPAQNVLVGATVTLNGSTSTDANGDALSYAWVLTSRPAGSAAALVGQTTATPTFVADVAGSYVATLVVDDGLASSAAATVTITATLNTTPVANAGLPQNVLVGATVALNGSASSDADGNALTYAWTLTSRPATSAAVLSGATTATPGFVADVAGSYVATLVVSDGLTSSAPSTVIITAVVANSAPVANAGLPQSVLTGATVTLSGAGSTDVNGDALSYAWTLSTVPPGSAAVLQNANTVAPSFVADVAGSYVATLVVNDGQLASAAATVTITAAAGNAAPVANAGPTQNVGVGTLVTLDGRGSSDPDGDAISYAWTLSTLPAGSAATLSGATSAQPTFTADVAGSYVATLVVSDGARSSAPVTVTITAAAGNSAPVANAGPDRTVFVGNQVTVDGRGSFDANGDALTYRWSLIQRPAGASASLGGSTTATPLFSGSLVGTYVLQLIVNDGKVDSAPDTVTISVLRRP